jgi:hypothetical protein
MKGKKCHEAAVCRVDHRSNAYPSPLCNIPRRQCVTVVPKANEEDGELDTDGMLWDVGVVVKDAIVFDEFHDDTLTRRYTGKPDLSGAKRYGGAK